MTQQTDIRILNARMEIEPVPFRAPLKFGGRVVTEAKLINVVVEVEDGLGNRISGQGSMPMGNIWAWPSQLVDADTSEKAMIRMAQIAVDQVGQSDQAGHPIDLMLSLMDQYANFAAQVEQEMSLPEAMPRLAQLVATSPLDAAVHDAFGRIHNRNSYDTLSSEFMNHDLSHYLGDQFQGEYLDQYTTREPQAQMPLYHLVGAIDPLVDADISKRIDDGLPETLGEWIIADGLTHLKIKLSGENLKWDIQRVLSIEEVATPEQAKRGCSDWVYSVDFNEKCANVEYVLDFLEGVRSQSASAFDRIQYIEQPTHRDLKKHPENKMHRAAEIKPVVIDESLLDLESLLMARDLGYTGVAFKACKGQTETLLLAAAAIKNDMFLCVQDLTCPGASFLHSASLAARIPGVAAIEGNARQFCPAANTEWAKKFPGMFNITKGTVETSLLNQNGLGF
ncbi:MAG: hypothetical protein JKY95_05660 [Planctomycetaceae bacterium]|nr:hypothetical protein [Planctomycetaceae bacterium]